MPFVPAGRGPLNHEELLLDGVVSGQLAQAIVQALKRGLVVLDELE